MKTIPLLGFFLAVVCAQGAHAASYGYAGQPIIPCANKWCSENYQVGTRFGASVFIDELLLPRGILLSARVDTSIDLRGEQRISIVSPFGTFTEAIPASSLGWSPTAVMPVNSFLDYTVDYAGLSFETNRFGEIVAWDGSVMTGGSSDYGIGGNRENTGADGTATGQSTAGQGTWFGRSIYAPSTAAVPVPAALPLLILALSALGLVKRRRRA